MSQGKSVFVGNIDFDIPEDEIIKELSTVGRVVNFRLMYDKTTGRSKGYGFCEYESCEIAELARNTLKIDFNGRMVKINYAENDIPQKSKDNLDSAKTLQMDKIISIIDDMNDADFIKEIMRYMKQMAINQPTQLCTFLRENPNLVCATMQLMLKCKIMTRDQALKILNKSFSVGENKEQIRERLEILSKRENLGEDVKSRIEKIYLNFK